MWRWLGHQKRMNWNYLTGVTSAAHNARGIDALARSRLRYYGG
jgi:hypothetical protein